MIGESRQAELRALPSVDELLKTEVARTLLEDHSRAIVTEAARRAIAARRSQLLEMASGSTEFQTWSPQVALEDALTDLSRPSLCRVINATGVALHTNLGRAPLARRALERVVAVSERYSNLEYDLARRRRGSRHGHLTEILRDVCGAEDAVVVNNNAAAVLLVASALAAGREVIVSRGELIEIGGSFRIPDIVAAGGARLREVGTTNRTRIDDYRRAIGKDTALLLKVHRSNFSIEGFTLEVSAAELAALGKETGIAVAEDLGSGALIDLRTLGLPHEPTAREQLDRGIDLVTFSGDKLLGGPQAGVVAGRADLVGRIRQHPLMRAMRPDKMTLAALEATCVIYRDGTAIDEIPALRALATPAAALRERADRLADRIRANLVPGPTGRPIEPIEPIEIDVQPTRSKVGGGALPKASLPSFAVTLHPTGRSAVDLDNALRRGEPAVVSRMVDDRVLLDVRTLEPDEIETVAAAVCRAVGAIEHST